jgi:hypothetical protein
MRSRAAIAAVLAALIGALAFQWYLMRASPQVPYMDSLRYIGQLERLLHGRLSWQEAWNFGEHRGLWYPIVQLVEWIGWGLDARVSTKLTGAVVLATLAIWLRQWWLVARDPAAAAAGERRAWTVVVIPAVAALVAFSPAGFEIWLLDLGFAQLLKNLCIVAFLALWAREVDAASDAKRRPWLGVAGGVLVLVVAYGWSYLFTVAALVALVATRDWSARDLRYRLLLGVPLLAAQIAYVAGGHGVLTRGSSILDAGGLPVLVQGVLLASGSALIGYHTAMRDHLGHAGLMLLGIVPLVAFAIAALRVAADGIDAPRRFHLSLALFGLGTLGAAAFSRSGEVIEAAAASRYFVDYQWLILGTLGLACDRRRLGRPLVRASRWPALAAWVERFDRRMLPVLVVAIVAGHVATWSLEWRLAASRAAYFAKMRDVYLEGVHSDQDAAMLQAPFDDAKRGVEVAERYALGPFRALRASCAVSAARFEEGWFEAGTPNEKWIGGQGVLRVTGCGSRVALDVYLPAPFLPRTLTASTGRATVTVPLKPGETAHVELEAPPGTASLRIELQVDKTTIPRATGTSPDDRALGALLTRIQASAGP